MNHIKFYTLLFSLFMIATNTMAESQLPLKKFELRHTHKISLASPDGVLHELVVTLPLNYEKDKTKKYPVVFYTDAHWDAPLLNSIYEALFYDESIPEFIMVGLSYPENISNNYSADRTRDLTPTKDSSMNQITGGADDFLKFIKATVVPKIESEYRVEKGQRAIAGWSYGGLFALYTLYKDPKYFSRCIAISPSVQWDNGLMNKIDSAYFSSNKELKARVFISYGTKEIDWFVSSVSGFQKLVETRNYQGLYLKNFVVNDLTHNTSKATAYIHGLVWIWQDIHQQKH